MNCWTVPPPRWRCRSAAGLKSRRRAWTQSCWKNILLATSRRTGRLFQAAPLIRGHRLLSERTRCPQGHFSNGSICWTFSPETSPCGIYSRHLISPVKWDFCLNMKMNVLKNKLMDIGAERGGFPSNKTRETNNNEWKTSFPAGRSRLRLLAAAAPSKMREQNIEYLAPNNWSKSRDLQSSISWFSFSFIFTKERRFRPRGPPALK